MLESMGANCVKSGFSESETESRNGREKIVCRKKD